MGSNFIEKYFFILFSIIPISITAGPLISLVNVIIIDISFLIYAFYLKEWSWLKDKRIQLLLLLSLRHISLSKLHLTQYWDNLIGDGQ